MELKTNISQAFWCSLAGGHAAFEPAFTLRGSQGDEEEISWLDKLFRGHIHVPEVEGRPLTVLLTGPPGSGKTTLAMELCYRLAKNQCTKSHVTDSKRTNLLQPSLFSLYVSTDLETETLKRNFLSYGYSEAEHFLTTFQGNTPEVPVVAVYGRDKIRSWDNLAQMIDFALEELEEWFKIPSKPARALVKRLLTKDPNIPGSKKVRPDVLVVDSLNIVGEADQGRFFQHFLTKASPATKMLVFVLDSGSAGAGHKYWEYACDIVIRLDYTSVRDYYLRTIEIVKARYQGHVLGKHQVKIYERPTLPSESDPHRDAKLRRYHPYRQEGGIFIYPSIHYYLSNYKHGGHTEDPKLVDTCPQELCDIVSLPEGRCTAFIGTRGGHKSHLGYLHLLHRILNHDEAGLVVSLRDDERMTESTMEQIRQQEFKKSRRLDELEQDDRLEILYYHPGYITPEEFFHRMYLSILRLKHRKRKLTVLFNSLDQLGGRFPLCAKQEIFVPGIIEALSGEGATSIFIAVDEPGQPVEQYGLLPMADLILSFYPYRFTFEGYYSHLNAARGLAEEKGAFKDRIGQVLETEKSTHRDEIVLKVVRFAGGQRAGAQGILELADGKRPTLYAKPGLHFTRLSPQFDPGKPLSSDGRWL